MTARARILGTVALLTGGLILLVVLSAPRRVAEFYGERLEATAMAASLLLIPDAHTALANKDAAAGVRICERGLVVPHVTYVELLDASGATFAEAGERPAPIDQLPMSSAIRYAGPAFIVIQQDAARDVGTLRVAVSRAGVNERVAQFRSQMLGVAAVMALLGIVAALLLIRWVVRPLEAITEGVRRLELGEAKELDLGNAGGEIGELAQAVNRMRNALATSYTELARAARRARIRADKLERANVELDRFAHAASHDLRAPLRGISTLAEFIAEDIGEADNVPEEVVEHLDLLMKRVTRMDELLMSLLDYSRIGRAAMKSEEVDVRAVLEEAVSMLDVPDTIEVRLSGDFPIIDTSRAALHRVFAHLIGNAVKHHDRHTGLVVVACTTTLTHAVFTVKDDGPGIPEELQKKAFKIFSTLKRRDVVEGSGMGLAIIDKVVDSMGGELSLESSGRGCTFTVKWPTSWQEEERTEVGPRSTMF